MKNFCLVAVSAAICFICSIIFLTSFVIPYSEYYDFYLEECTISNISYPTRPPTFNDTNNWSQCDCGKYCSSWSPCIKLYDSNNSNIVIKNRFHFDNNEECTFHNYSCPNCENLQQLEIYLNDANSIYNDYYNKTVSCYKDYPITNIYLEKNLDFIGAYVLTVLIGLSLLCILYNCIN